MRAQTTPQPQTAPHPPGAATAPACVGRLELGQQIYAALVQARALIKDLHGEHAFEIFERDPAMVEIDTAIKAGRWRYGR
jgi:hypothetical protein